MSIESSSKNRHHKVPKSTNIKVENTNENWIPQEQELSSYQTEEIPECNCTDHHGKVYLDQIFEMSFSYLFECLFEFNEFYYQFLKTRKISDFNANDWKIEDNIKTRKSEYLIEISHAIASKYCKNIEQYKIIKYIENKICVVDTETFSSGVIYSDCFKICHRFCITASPTNRRCRLKVHSSLIYLSKPNFVVKALIDKNCYSSLNEFFRGMQESLQNECERMQKFHCSIVKTSTESDLKNLGGDTKSFLTSSMTSSKDFSSDDEISSTDETTKTKKSSYSAIWKSSSSTKFVCHSEPKENQISIPNKRPKSYKQYEKDKITNSFEFIESNHNERINDSLNFFIKFFLVLMLVVFIFNLILYSKLREIEKIAVLIKHQYKPNTS